MTARHFAKFGVTHDSQELVSKLEWNPRKLVYEFPECVLKPNLLSLVTNLL